MNINESIRRIKFTVENGNRPNDTDIKAFNEIVDWVERQRAETVNKNHLFAKLYIYYLNQFIDKFESTVFSEIPEGELHKKLSMPIQNYFQAFTNSLNDSNRYRILRSKGVEFGKHPNETDKKGNGVELKDFKDVWDVDTVEKKLTEMIVEALNKLQ